MAPARQRCARTDPRRNAAAVDDGSGVDGEALDDADGQSADSGAGAGDGPMDGLDDDLERFLQEHLPSEDDEADKSDKLQPHEECAAGNLDELLRAEDSEALTDDGSGDEPGDGEADLDILLHKIELEMADEAPPVDLNPGPDVDLDALLALCEEPEEEQVLPQSPRPAIRAAAAVEPPPPPRPARAPKARPAAGAVRREAHVLPRLQSSSWTCGRTCRPTSATMSGDS